MSDIRENIKKIMTPVVEKFEGYEFEEIFDLEIPIPAHTITAKVLVTKAIYSEGDRSIIDQPISVEIKTFDNDAEKVLDRIVPLAVASQLVGKLPVEIDSDDVYIGGHTTAFPHKFHFGEKSKQA